MTRIARLAGLLLAMTAAGEAKPPKPDPATPTLLPISDEDTNRIRQSGCESWFTIRDTGYLFSQGSDFLLRTAPGRAGLAACHLPTRQADGFEQGRPIACGGRTLTLRKTGRVTGHEEADSADYPAALTVSDGTHARTLRGRYGTAC